MLIYKPTCVIAASLGVIHIMIFVCNALKSHTEMVWWGPGEGGVGEESVTNDAFKIIEFQSLRVVNYFSYIYLIINGERSLHT